MMWLLACLPLLGSLTFLTKDTELSTVVVLRKNWRMVFEVRLEFQRNIIFWLHDIEQLVSLTVSKIYQRLLIHTLPNNILSATKMTIFSECVVWVNLSRIKSDRSIRNSSQKDPKAVIYLFWFLPCETLYE